MNDKEWQEKINNIKPTDEICFNCNHVIWAVAVGVGVICRNDKNKVDNKSFRIPSRFHSCEYFQLKETLSR